METKVNRRSFVRVGSLTGVSVLVAACTPAAAPAPAAPAKPAWETQWNEWVAAAKKEGKVVVNFTGAGASWQKIGEAFSAAYPGITAEVTTFGSSRLWTPRVVQEFQAGIFSWDITQIAIDDIMSTLLPQQMVIPLKEHIIRPEAVDNNVWHKGYQWGYLDPEKKYGFGFGWRGLNLIYANTDLVKDGDIKSAKDLLDPKWKGKFIFGDPRIYGGTIYPAVAIRANLGEDFMKKLFVDQAPAYSRDFRQITEGVVRGKYAFGTGIQPAILDEFKAAGLGDKLRLIEIPEAFLPSATLIWMMNKAPHPNAAKVFINWFLTKEAQTVYAEATKQNSRRKDAPIVDKANEVDPIREYKFVVGTVDTLEHGKQVEALFNEWLK